VEQHINAIRAYSQFCCF